MEHRSISKDADELTPAALMTLLVIYALNPPTEYPDSSNPFKRPFTRSTVPAFFSLGFQMVQVNGKVLVISLAYNMYMAGAVLCGNAHAIPG